MKNPGKALREAYMAALAGLQYDGKSIMVYEFLPLETLPDNYVYINGMATSQVGNNHAFIHDATIIIDIVTKQYKKLDYDVVDGIAQAVFDKLLTYPYSTIANSDFGFMNPQVQSDQYLIEPDGSTWLVRKVITFTQSIIEK